MFADSPFAVVDAFASVLWLAANVLLVFAAVRVAERIFPEDHGANKVLNVSVLAISILTVVLLLLGAASILSGASMLGCVLAVSLILLWRIRKRDIANLQGSETTGVTGITSFWLLLTGLLCGHCLVNGLLKVVVQCTKSGLARLCVIL